MKKMFKLSLVFLTLMSLSTYSKAQSTSLCDGVKYIYSNLTKANFDKLPEEYASRISGWKAIMKNEGDDSYSYTFEYEVKNDKEVQQVFKKLTNQFTSCLGVKPYMEGSEESSEANFEYKEGEVMLYQRWSTQSQWIVISIIR